MVPCLSGAFVNRPFSGERVLVTGAGGFIGRRLCSRLIELQATVVAVDCRTPTLEGALPGFVRMDLASPDEIRALDGVDPTLVFHLAVAGASDPFLPPEDALRVNVFGTMNLLQTLGGRVPVVVARTAAERNPSSPYAASKAAVWVFCQMFARTRGWPLLGAMVFQCYGLGQSARNVLPAALAAACAGEEFSLSPGGGSCVIGCPSTTWSRDCWQWREPSLRRQIQLISVPEKVSRCAKWCKCYSTSPEARDARFSARFHTGAGKI